MFRYQIGTVWMDNLSVRYKSRGCSQQCNRRGSCHYDLCRCYDPYSGASCEYTKSNKT